MERRTSRRAWLRPDIAAAMAEARLLRSKHVACGRCQEEVAAGAVWCPHCGFDMGRGGTIEVRRRTRRQWHSVVEQVRQRLAWGVVGAAIVAIIYVCVSLVSPHYGIVFGFCCFIVAVWVIGCDLSPRAAISCLPTAAATFVLLYLAPPLALTAH